MRYDAVLAMIFSIAALLPGAATAAERLAFPGAQGWAAHTPGGRGGKLLRVTTLAPDGPGSIRAALEASGPRIVVFEVGVFDVLLMPTRMTSASSRSDGSWPSS